jgi:hypothetical protein
MNTLGIRNILGVRRAAHPCVRYGRNVDAPENTVEAREESMRVQLAGVFSAVTREEAEAGLAAARADIESGRGSGYGVGFGFVKSFGSPNGLDGIRVEFAITDGERVANVHATVSGTQLSMLGKARSAPTDDEILTWMFERLYQMAGAIPRSANRYAMLLASHPLSL